MTQETESTRDSSRTRKIDLVLRFLAVFEIVHFSARVDGGGGGALSVAMHTKALPWPLHTCRKPVDCACTSCASWKSVSTAGAATPLLLMRTSVMAVRG